MIYYVLLGSFLDGEWSNIDGDDKEDNMFSGEDQDRLDSTDLQQIGDDVNNVLNGDLEEKDSLFNESLYNDQNAKVNYDIVKLENGPKSSAESHEVASFPRSCIWFLALSTEKAPW